MTFRLATASDAPRLCEIYNQAIRSQRCTCDIEEVTLEERLAWMESHNCREYPLYVCQEDGKVIGYGYLSPYRFGRAALAHVVEVSYYLDFDYVGQGRGRMLLTFLEERAKALGYEDLCAVLVSNNPASIALLESRGFTCWGCFRGVVHLGGQRTDHIYYGKSVQ